MTKIGIVKNLIFVFSVLYLFFLHFYLIADKKTEYAKLRREKKILCVIFLFVYRFSSSIITSRN